MLEGSVEKEQTNYSDPDAQEGCRVLVSSWLRLACSVDLHPLIIQADI